MRNSEIRLELLKHGMKQNQLAEILGYSEWHFSKLMNRKEFDEEEKQHILQVIKDNVCVGELQTTEKNIVCGEKTLADYSTDELLAELKRRIRM